MALDERTVDEAGPDVLRPARALEPVVGLGGVEAQAGDHHVGVAAVGVDRDPGATPALAPALHVAGGQGGLEDVGALAAEDVADGARAVVTARVDPGVPSAGAVARV